MLVEMLTALSVGRQVAEQSDLNERGDVVPIKVAGTGVILANHKGSIKAFHNVCRHRGASLSSVSLLCLHLQCISSSSGAKLVEKKCKRRSTILCPYHRWGYALDGRCVGTPAFDADETGKAIPEKLREKFRTYHVKNFDKKDMVGICQIFFSFYRCNTFSMLMPSL